MKERHLEEEKTQWKMKYRDIIPACFDDKKRNYVCNQCRFEFCRNYIKIHNKMEIKK